MSEKLGYFVSHVHLLLGDAERTNDLATVASLVRQEIGFDTVFRVGFCD